MLVHRNALPKTFTLGRKGRGGSLVIVSLRTSVLLVQFAFVELQIPKLGNDWPTANRFFPRYFPFPSYYRL